MGLKRATTASAWQVRGSRGFSLVELLVVLLLIVMVAGMVSLNVSSGGQETRLAAQVRNLAETAQYALDEAQFTGRDHGLLIEQVDQGGQWLYAYTWHQRAIDGWRAPAGDPEVSLELEIENSPFSEVGLDEAEESRGPQVVFYASGETAVGAINVRRREDGELLWRIEWDLLGRFELLPGGVPDDEWEDP